MISNKLFESVSRKLNLSIKYIKNNQQALASFNFYSTNFNTQKNEPKINFEQSKQLNNTNNKNDTNYSSNNEKSELKNLLNQANRTVVNPLKHEDFFDLNKLVDIEELFKARCHYGHDAGLRCPWMSEYIYGTRIKTDIIDLDKTVPMLRKALNFMAHIAFRKGVILFITRYAQHIPLVERTASEAGEYSHCKLWSNGLFTDSTRRFGSVIRLPDLCVFLHTHEKLNETHSALNESAKMLIPTIAICDTDIDPSIVTYPIPGNDDSIASIQLYCDLFKKAILAGKEKRKELESKNVLIEYEPVSV